MHQGQGLPRHDHPEALRRPGVLRLRPFGSGAEAVHALRGSGGVGDGAQLAGSGRTAAALRHRGTEGPLPAAPGQGPGDPGLRADQPAGRLGCRLDPRPRHRLQGPVAGQGSRSACASPGTSATSRSGRSARCSASPSACTTPTPARRRRKDPRHHLRAGADRPPRREHRPPPLPAECRVPERAELGQGCVHAARTGSSAARPWPARAGAC
jgi:hypothetical protein